MANTTVSNSHIDTLIDYILDVKPYHTKLSEIVEEYIFSDSFEVSVSEAHEMMCVIGPDYLNSSGNAQRNVWENAPVRPISSLNATRVFQSDGTRRVYQVPAILHHKTGGETGNIFTKVVAATGTEIPGLSMGVFNQQKFYSNEVKSVKVNGVSKTKDVDYFISRGAYSFTVNPGAQTWKQHNLSGIAAIPSKAGLYAFDSLVRNFGTITAITVSQAASVFEEWTISYASATTVDVVGSISGFIGTATFGVPFVHSKISFTYQQAPGEEVTPVMSPGHQFLLTPTNRVCVHPSAPAETWTLINVGAIYKVYGSLSGWQADATPGTWYDNSRIAFKVPALKAWIYVNGASEWAWVPGDKVVTVSGITNSAIPSVYEVVFRSPAPSQSGVDSGTVFNNVKGYLRGVQKNIAWNDDWLTLNISGTWADGDTIKIVLAPETFQAWFAGYDESPYDFTLYDMGTAERRIPIDMLQEWFPLYHSKDAIIIPVVDAGNTVAIEKVQNEYIRLRLGHGEALHHALASDNGWVPLEYRPNTAFPAFVTAIDAYLASDPTLKVFTVTQPSIAGKPGLASIEFGSTFFTDFITGSTQFTLQFHQADNYGPLVGVNFAEEINIQMTRLLGPELNPDTGFDAPTWVLQTGALVSGGVYTLTAATGNSSAFRGAASLLPSTTYEVIFTVDSISSSNVSAYLGGGVGTLRTIPGTYTEWVTTPGSLANQNIAIRSGVTSTTAQMSFFSVRKVGP